MTMTELQKVSDWIRPKFEHDVGYVEKYLQGKGLDMGCGNCPLLKENCLHIDRSPQPTAIEQVGENNVIITDAVNYQSEEKVDYIFSSHMVEDLPDRQAIIDCLNGWAERLLKPEGFIVLLLPDMQGGRYPTVESGGNPSHQVNVGYKFIKYNILNDLKKLSLEQLDTIPYEKSASIDVVFMRTQ